MLPFILGAIGVAILAAPVGSLINRVRGVQPPSSNSDLQARSFDTANGALKERDSSRKPTPADITLLRTLLARKLKLPVDIVDVIFDFAEYWAHSSREVDFLAESGSPFRIVGRFGKEDCLLLRSFPIGFTSFDLEEDQIDVSKYNSEEAEPRPLVREHLPSFFSRLVNYPTPRLTHPARKIVFTLRSRDQGGHRRETYDESWTWFEAGLERFDADQACDASCARDALHPSPESPFSKLPICSLRPIYPTLSEKPSLDVSSGESNDAVPSPSQKEYAYDHGFMPVEDRVIQRNRGRNREVKTHVVEWSWTDDINPDSDQGLELREKGRGRASGDGRFVRDLKLGDVVTIWGKAKFPAWVNHVEMVKVDIYWAV